MMLPSTKRPIVLLLEGGHLRAAMAKVLGRANFDVIEVHNSAEALETLEAREDVDVLLADIDAAGAGDGLELSRCVHARWPWLGLVLTSEWVRRLRPDDVPGNGCFLPHPVPTETLLNEVRQAARHQ
jgi:DNA-binding NtrC family response regulator